jgi:hypothetical protein
MSSIKASDIDQMSPSELNELKLRVERRLQHIDGRDGRSLVEELSGKEKIDLLALAVKRTGIRCRILGGGEAVTLRPGSGVRTEAEAHILTVLIFS